VQLTKTKRHGELDVPEKQRLRERLKKHEEPKMRKDANAGEDRRKSSRHAVKRRKRQDVLLGVQHALNRRRSVKPPRPEKLSALSDVEPKGLNVRSRSPGQIVEDLTWKSQSKMMRIVDEDAKSDAQRVKARPQRRAVASLRLLSTITLMLAMVASPEARNPNSFLPKAQFIRRRRRRRPAGHILEPIHGSKITRTPHRPQRIDRLLKVVPSTTHLAIKRGAARGSRIGIRNMTMSRKMIRRSEDGDENRGARSGTLSRAPKGVRTTGEDPVTAEIRVLLIRAGNQALLVDFSVDGRR
jgi:hypothetical protein